MEISKVALHGRPWLKAAVTGRYAWAARLTFHVVPEATASA